MSNIEIFKLIGGSAVAIVIAFFTITNNFLNIKDRIIKVRDNKKKKKYKASFKENNPDYEFTLNYLSNPQINKCILKFKVLNVSKETKFIESTSFNFQDTNNPKKYLPSSFFVGGETWPKRLEHGEFFSNSNDFTSTVLNSLFDYYRNNIKVYVSCKSTTGDLIRSNFVDFDKLSSFLEPINICYYDLSISLSEKFNSSQRDIEVSLWQLQIFKRLTVNVVKQLEMSNIPITEYLIENHGLTYEKDLWSNWYYDLENKKISPSSIKEFLIKL